MATAGGSAGCPHGIPLHTKFDSNKPISPQVKDLIASFGPNGATLLVTRGEGYPRDPYDSAVLAKLEFTSGATGKPLPRPSPGQKKPPSSVLDKLTMAKKGLREANDGQPLIGLSLAPPFGRPLLAGRPTRSPPWLGARKG